MPPTSLQHQQRATVALTRVQLSPAGPESTAIARRDTSASAQVSAFVAREVLLAIESAMSRMSRVSLLQKFMCRISGLT
jgi:hypothetical protein